MRRPGYDEIVRASIDDAEQDRVKDNTTDIQCHNCEWPWRVVTYPENQRCNCDRDWNTDERSQPSLNEGAVSQLFADQNDGKRDGVDK